MSSPTEILYLVHHIFLPPCLPQTGDDRGKGAKDLRLLQTLLEALQHFKSYLSAEDAAATQKVCRMIKNLLSVTGDDGYVREEELFKAFASLSENEDILPIFINEQNAALIVRNDNDSLLFESFELWLPNKIVMQTQGRVRRFFPSNSTAVDITTFQEEGYQSMLAQTVARMSRQVVKEAHPVERKANQNHREIRDTINPKMVITFLMDVLGATGRAVTPSQIGKNTREEVLWSTGRVPWRRSPVWLLARVAMQATFGRVAASEDLYKEFMVFLTGHILDLAVSADFPSDLLNCMICKISRRLLKLKQPSPPWKWLESVTKVVERARHLIEKRWKSIEMKSHPEMDTSTLHALDFAQDTVAQLHDLDAFIKLLSCPPLIPKPTIFHPPSLVAHLPSNNMPLGILGNDASAYSLTAFEIWVASKLDTWLGSSLPEDEAISQLSRAIHEYHGLASVEYMGNPENLSIMLLTTFELWVACDKIASQQVPMLQDYDPEIPVGLLQSLLLPLLEHAERLSRVEAYINSRQQKSKPKLPSIFSGFGTPHCFPVRYYASSEKHQDLRSRIEKFAQDKRQQKKTELAKKKQLYYKLMQSYQSMECEKQERYLEYGYIQGGVCSCQRCKYLEEARSMTIDMDEWPLPYKELEAQSTVFELDCPSTIVNWRNATVFLLTNILKSEYRSADRADHNYGIDHSLSLFLNRQEQRLILLSETKPHAVIHRSPMNVSEATESAVCVNNGLSFHYVDRSWNLLARNITTTEEMPKALMYQLPNIPLLQHFTYRPWIRPNGPPPNDAISKQSMCPVQLSLSEFRALAALPLGYRIQWMNVLAQLALPSIDFRKVETYLVLLQVIRQAGPPSPTEVVRDGHETLRDPYFGRKLVHYLEDGLARIKENWESFQALGILVAITTRLVSCAECEDVQNAGLEFLKVCRETALGWARLLRDKAQNTEDEQQQVEFLLRIFEICHVLMGTFDLDSGFFTCIFSDHGQLACFVECSILIHDTSRSALWTQNPVLRLYSDRFVRLTTRVLSVLLAQITELKSPGLDLALQNVWSGYRPSGSWRSCGAETRHWLVNLSEADSDTDSQEIHYNLLTGDLLIDGMPLSRLPAPYESHPRYEDFFGGATIEVVPASMPGFQFQAMRPVQGCTVYLGLTQTGDSENDLMISYVRGNEQYDLVPLRVFQDALPEHFVRDYAHWRCRRSGVIEFRPVKHPWQKESSWYLTQHDSGWITRNVKDGILIPTTSPTCREISRFFDCLEKPPFLHITLRPDKNAVDVRLPRLKVQFTLAKASHILRSREFRDMYLDPNQRVGTLIGLKSRLVLTNDRGHRLLLVPNGGPKHSRMDEHVSVNIEPGTSDKLFPYRIDTRLGRLVDNGSLQSKLHIAHLHALTAFCLPDKLTGKTGTEQALSILSSAAVRSFGQLTRQNLDTLHGIARLTPQRDFYPSHLRVMQKVVWDQNLSFLSQTGCFCSQVRSIIDHESSLAFFHDAKPENLRIPDRGEDFLLERESIRGSIFRRPGFGGDLKTKNSHDCVYTGRGGKNKVRSTLAFVTAARIYGGFKSLQYEPPANLQDNLWELLSSKIPMQGPDDDSPLDWRVGYDGQWLENWKSLLRVNWCQIHHILGAGTLDKFQIMIFLATLAFASDANIHAIELLVAIHNNSAVDETRPPAAKWFELQKGRDFQEEELNRLVRYHLKKFKQSPEANLPRVIPETRVDAAERRIKCFQKNCNSAVRAFVNAIKTQWPCEKPCPPRDKDWRNYIKPEAYSAVLPQIRIWWDNYRFFEYLTEISGVLRACKVNTINKPRVKQNPQPPATPRESGYVSINRLFSFTSSSFSHQQLDLSILLQSSSAQTGSPTVLRDTVKRLESLASRDYESSYADTLSQSLESLERVKPIKSLTKDSKEVKVLLEENLKWSASRLQDAYEVLLSSLTHPRSDCVTDYNAPTPSPAFFLSQLGRDRWSHLPSVWKCLIVKYALAIADIQRAERLWEARDSPTDLTSELLNPGHTNWDPYERPEWLLVEVESGILFRREQIEIAGHMRDPPGNKNASMQLMMGEGKSSVIIPIVAASLADGSKLVRIVCGKAQSRQLLDMLVAKLGGLSNRRIYHMPFSRSLQLGSSEVQAMLRTYRQCMESGGIMLLQPEHILSFKLAGIENRVTGREDAARSFMEAQLFFDDFSRDIVDECDENFSVKFELIYTIGTQKPIELCPERWELLQAVLRIIPTKAEQVLARIPHSVTIERGPAGSFPRIRFIHEDAQKAICEEVAREICSSGLPRLPICRQPPAVRQAVFTYIIKAELSAEEVQAVESNKKFWTDAIRPRLLLLRGIIACGVLCFAFGSKRWRVNYGLDRSRRPQTRLAVPFRAKDNPTLRSEFSHSDVVIVLTCLSYYYGGLENEELFAAFEHLLKSNEADVRFSEWVKDTLLPEEFRSLQAINLKDRHQCITRVFPSLRKSNAVVDYYLSSIVFAKEIREFPLKLSASGWDIGQEKANPTTGFSGTNDSRHLLPTMIQYLDLERQRNTNALVLRHLLGVENEVELMLPEETQGSSHAHQLLRHVTQMSKPVQVILDAGAQILELESIEVAATWLKMVDSEDKQAAVFFNNEDELSVIDRNGYVELLKTSPFAKQLDQCLVFLDDAHTRGTDLRLPLHYRAAVTLGAGLTKDRLVQACMRMRKLGKGQSVVFLVSPEIQSKIRAIPGRSDEDPITVSDVLVWSVLQTHLDLRRSIPLWANQGVRFERQKDLWSDCKTETTYEMTLEQAKGFLEKEASELHTRYSPRRDEKDVEIPNQLMNRDALVKISERCKHFGVFSLDSASLNEEQERELAPEAEQERQVERPGPAESAQHMIHDDVKELIRSGNIELGSPAFMGAFQSFAATSAAAYCDLAQLPQDVLVTRDFARTIQLNHISLQEKSCDAYQRPVQWILTIRQQDVRKQHSAVIISPYEAQELFPVIKNSSHVVLHVYVPRHSLAYNPVDDLKLYRTPYAPDDWRLASHLRLWINLFSGQLYLASLAEYREVCTAFGFAHESTKDGIEVDAEGFILGGTTENTSGFTKSPAVFLNILFSQIRRDCQGINRTHWGRILGGELLRQDDFA